MIKVPLPNLGFSLAGFTRSTSMISHRHRHCGTFIGIHTLFYNLGVLPAVNQILIALTYGFVKHEHYNHRRLCEHGLSSMSKSTAITRMLSKLHFYYPKYTYQCQTYSFNECIFRREIRYLIRNFHERLDFSSLFW